MKSIIFIGVILLLCFSSCSEDGSEFMSNGTITGIDFRECVCCGGYFIEINDSTYRFYTMPSGSDVPLENPVFPIYVKLDWAKADTVCLGDEIKVLRIEKR
jgi:hypothetical protein